MELPKDIQSLAEAWPSPWVARKEISKFSGGLLHPRTMANLDSLGVGPPRFAVNRCVGYPVDGLLVWLAQRFRAAQA